MTLFISFRGHGPSTIVKFVDKWAELNMSMLFNLLLVLKHYPRFWFYHGHERCPCYSTYCQSSNIAYVSRFIIDVSTGVHDIQLIAGPHYLRFSFYRGRERFPHHRALRWGLQPNVSRKR